MENLKKNVKKALDFHLIEACIAKNILIGDREISKILLEKKCSSQQYDELYNYSQCLLTDQIHKEIKPQPITPVIDDPVEQEIINIINLIAHEGVRYELLRINNGNKKKLRAKMALCIDSKNYRLAALIELFHLATLIQDDIIDKATIRRYVPTINHVHGDRQALIISDLLLILILLELRNFFIPLEAKANQVDQNKIKDYFEMLVFEMLKAEERNNLVDITQYSKYAKGKTGNLFGFSLVASCIKENELYKDDIDEIFEYGCQYGILFQIIDDYRDVYFQKVIGKDGFDSNNEILNYVTLKNISQEKLKYEIQEQLNIIEQHKFAKLITNQIEVLKRSLDE